MMSHGSSGQEPSADPRELRRAMGRFAGGVTVVATRTGGDVHAMTANAFVSVSLEPPLVLVSLGEGTRMADLVDRTGHYGVSVLAEHHEAHSRRFAGQPTVDTSAEFADADGIPLLTGALAHIGCRVEDRMRAGDHILYLGRVVHLDHRDGDPLIFYTGRYRVLHSGADEILFAH